MFRYVPLALPPIRALGSELGAFHLAGAWRMESANDTFNSFSALLLGPDRRFTAWSDRGWRFAFPPPGQPGQVLRFDLARTLPHASPRIAADSESATRDRASGSTWIGWEGSNRITRHDPTGRLTGQASPRAMRAWGANQGPEALVRLADGSFLALCEGFTGWTDDRRHPAVRFAGDPVDRPGVIPFTFDGPRGFKPTDIAQLPDGRVLILMRKVVWPAPIRFAARLVLADPASIVPGQPWRGTVVAQIGSLLPLDNFEGIAVNPRADGQLDVWLVSDSNQAALQANVLWRLVVDPTALR
jgi:hypothetical protein